MSRNTLADMLGRNIPMIENKNLYIWGTGNTALLYQEGINRLEKEGFFEILGYCDNYSDKWGSIFGGRPVISPDDLSKLKDVCVLICSSQPKVFKEVHRQLNDFPVHLDAKVKNDYQKQLVFGQSGRVENYLLDEVILKHHAEEILQVYDCLCDQKSKDTYEELVRCRMCNEFPDNEKIYSDDQYFSVGAFKRRDPKEVFVDCGGYVGDTVEQYLWHREGAFHKIISFELDKKNYNAMKYRTERLKREWNLGDDEIQLYHLGVGKENSKSVVQSYNTNHGLGSKIVSRDEEFGEVDVCEIIALDNFLKEPYHFLKADIESYEYGMLLGAEQGIKRYKPMLAICIYHNAVDFYSIPLLLHRFVPEYKFAIRHHSCELADTVLYAWIQE